MAVDPTRTLRGALAGATAAAVWSAVEPLDRRVFGVPYSDPELLGKTVTRGPMWPLVGNAMHVANGAAFGAAYATTAPLVPLPPVLRGPAAAMVEHLATWPLVSVAERVHPARDELPRLRGSRRAFWQATFRHLLFGLVLGELERRLNPPPAPAPAPVAHELSSNGHGDPARVPVHPEP